MSTRSILTTFRIAVLAAGVFFAFASAAFGVTIPTPVNWSTGVTTQYALPLPFGSVATTLTSYSGFANPYVTGTFYVGTSGTYSATLTSAPFANGIEILTGTFAPSTGTPTTPLANFFLAEQDGASTTLSIPLQAGVQYSYLLLFSFATTGSGTFTLSGPGCISLGSNTCSAVLPVPTLEPGAFALLAVLIAVSGIFFLRRPRTQA
jgi:hypothetical protein